ncbi:ABC transporter ATP-binding protein [Alkalihalobacterium chitinilyticum]|uniref:ABC transporter ATP-binding protein/permease n=1 Tax=Alkalihalobacterium chitinilyticum TaxID=2980103 RepID=A0ABT5VEC5_9BACI|nr:ABC transporter ATP-binding protein [Alkalihalobacterium chitinilyticum]MDE5413815.1 ABC transporter ATP-binding protein/permease [Alkalihalobacterium chitinilyticum]
MKHIFYFLKKIHGYAGKALYINLMAMLFISLLDGIGILLLIPLISMSGIVEFDTTGIPLLGAFQFFENIPSNIGLPIILGIFVLIVIGQNLLQKQITIKGTIIQHGFFRYLRVKTYDSILHANWSFFVKNRKSDLINLLTAEIARASAGTHSFLQFLSSLIFTFIQIGIAFWLSPTITTFVLVCGAVLVFLNRKFLKRSLELGSRNYTLGKQYLGGITDQINGIKDIKSNTLEESRMNWYRMVTKSMEQEQIEYTRLKTTSQLYYKIASAVLIATFIYFSVNLFNAQIAQLMLIIIIFSRLWPRVAGIQGSLEQIATTIPALQAVIAMQEECEKAREFTLAENAKVLPLQVHQAIECSNVAFRYNTKESKYALNNINVRIPANQMTAVVGPSGAGKSTLIDLLMGLNQPGKGQILIDGFPLSDSNLISLRKAISYVPQDPFLFNESIRENLQLVVPDATEAEMWEALEFSSAAEFVRKLPNGLDTLIGDRGIRLSGGERQRLVLARAILRKPSILVLDEATSALDTENESKIQEAIDRLKGRMTIIVIAHRLSTIRNADQVIVLDEGEIIQQGGFSQLAGEKKSMFSKLLNKQMEVLQSQTPT